MLNLSPALSGFYPPTILVYLLVGEADPGFGEAGRVTAATLLAALGLGSGLLDTAAMTSRRVAAPLRGLLSCACR